MIGFVLVDKPAGPTSHDVVDAARKALGVRRVGHAGTLDPPATGLVVVGVGAATRLLRFVQRSDKTYEATGVLGIRTTTLDAEGDVVSTDAVEVSEDDLRAVLADFTGEVSQVPPAVSAVKVGGERAYRRAARGESFDIEPRVVRIHDLDLLSFAAPRFSVRVRCSSGTYVRTLVSDIGDRVGGGAHVESLRRTAIGDLTVDEGVSLEDIGPQALRRVEDVLRSLPMVEVDAETAAKARHGQRLVVDAAPGEVLLCGPAGPIGVFSSEDGILRPVTVLPERP